LRNDMFPPDLTMAELDRRVPHLNDR
jgi:hypothetical protein